jgi:hypothetical protein
MDAKMKALFENMKAQNDLLSEMLKGDVKKDAGVASNAIELHGAGSLFANAGLERDIITAHVRPQGISTHLPLYASVYESPLFGSITGFTAEVGAEPAYPCSDAPTGYMKGCNLTAAFGRIKRDTNTIEIDRVMLKYNRGDHSDLLLRGSLLGLTDLTPSGLNQGQVLDVVTMAEMVIAGINVERKLSVTMWQGTPANNNAGGGYKEFPGLDLQIATGQVDAETGTTCPALDSDIKNFGYSLVDGTVRDIVDYLSSMEQYLRYNAIHMGLDPVSWVIVMRPELWFELSAVWPCRYLSNRCATAHGDQTLIINDNVNVAMRDAMRNGMYIDVNGNRYPVIVDGGIFEHTNINNANVPAGSYASSIYMVPLKIQGNFPVTYREHLDYRQATSDSALLNGMQHFWTDDGVWFWAIENQNFCYKLTMKTEQRIILRTPQLAGKIQNVRYSPLQHLRESVDPASPYFADGGVSLRANPTDFKAIWRNSGR